MQCDNCRERIEYCDYHGWEGNDGSAFCDWQYQPNDEYEIEHFVNDN